MGLLLDPLSRMQTQYHVSPVNETQELIIVSLAVNNNDWLESLQKQEWKDISEDEHPPTQPMVMCGQNSWANSEYSVFL